MLDFDVLVIQFGEEEGEGERWDLWLTNKEGDFHHWIGLRTEKGGSFMRYFVYSE